MFYDREQVDNHLNCKNCQKRFDLPRLLPCGDVICELCLNNIKNVGDVIHELKCPFCGSIHLTPKNGSFPVQKVLLSLLKLKPSDKPFRGVLIEELDEANVKLNHRLDGLKQFQENAKIKIDEKKVDLRKKIVESAEKKRNELKTIETKLKTKMDDYEIDVFNKMKQILDKIVQENEENVKIWTELDEDNENLDNDVKIVDSIDNLNKFIKEATDQEESLNIIIDNLELIRFNESKENISIGCLNTTQKSDDNFDKQQNDINCKTQ